MAVITLLCSCSGTRRKPANKSVEELLKSLTNDSDVRIRADAVRQLAASKDPTAVNALIMGLKDPEDNVRIAAASYLGGSRDPRAVKALCNALRDPSHGPAFRLATGRALASLHDACAVEPLIQGLRSGRPEASAALAGLGDLAVPSLVKALEDAESRDAASDVLATIGAAAVDPLIEILRHPENDFVRLAAVRALAEIADERAENALNDALKTPSEELTVAAYRFLIRKGQSGTENRLVNALAAHGKLEMAEDFVASGNATLKSAAEEWARKNKYPLAAHTPEAEVLHWGGADLAVRPLGLYHYDNSLASTSGIIPAQAEGVSFVPGKWGSALSVGTGGILKYPLAGHLDFREGTIEMWISPRFDGTNPIYQKYNHVLLLYHSPSDEQFLVSESILRGFYAGSVIRHDFKGTGGGNISSWKAGEWHHIAFTYSARAVRQRFFVDGVMTAEQKMTTLVPDPGTGTFTVGCDPYGNWSGFILDELQISGGEKSPYAIRGSASRKGPFADR